MAVPPACESDSAVSSIVSGRLYGDGWPLDAAAGAVDGRAGLAEPARDAASGAARRSGDDRDKTRERTPGRRLDTGRWL